MMKKSSYKSIKQKTNSVKVNHFTSKNAKLLFPKRKQEQNKTDFGKSLIVAGSPTFPGAAILCATACARIGSGYTFIATQDNLFPIHKHPDFIFMKPNQILKKQKEFSALAFGPGLEINSDNLKLLKTLLKITHIPIVIDASGLDLFLKIKPAHWGERVILTPHEGEMARLLGKSSAWVKKNRLTALDLAFKKWKCTILLKGSETLVRTQNKIYFINSGTPALAKSGTGDVLTGIITGLLAQRVSPSEAASLGSFIHGWCSQLWEKQGNNPSSLLASDLLSLISKLNFRH